MRRLTHGERDGWILLALLAIPAVAWTAAVFALLYWLINWMEEQRG
jgi:hypothetical protein